MLKKLIGMLVLAAIALGTMPTRSWAAEVNPPGERTTANTERAGAAKEEDHPLIIPEKASAIWTLIIFLILLAILYPTAWKQVLAGLKAREQRIRNDIAEADAAREKAEATLREYNAQLATAEGRTREMLSKATADAEALAAQIRARAQQEAQEAKDRATRDIDEARDRAVSEIYREAATLATNVAEKILRRNLNADDQRDLVAQSLEQMQTINRG